MLWRGLWFVLDVCGRYGLVSARSRRLQHIMPADPNIPLEELGPLPEIDVRQMLSLTDGTAMLQHAAYATPDLHHGYCTDDNARALIAGTLWAHLREYDEDTVPIQRYLAFLAYAFNAETGRFRNFMGYDRQWLEEIGSEDSHGRTVWGLGVAVRYAANDAILDMATRVFRQALSAIGSFRYIHPMAFSLIGLDEFLAAAPAEREAAKIRADLAEKFHALWMKNSTGDWPWWRDTLTWGNGKLPHALLVSGRALDRPDMVEAGLKALKWLLRVQTAPEGHLRIIGNDGWYVRGGTPAQFDQQPLEAHGLVDACLAAAEWTGDSRWLREARRCFEWFLGANDIGVPLYHPETGGCQDGLTPNGPNSNQGAESTLAYVLSTLQLHAYSVKHAPGTQVSVEQPLGYGVIGASEFADFCLTQFADLPDLAPLAVWSRTPKKGQEFAARHALRACRTRDDLLADPRIRVVHIATIPALHAEHARAALTAGKHVLVEKPLACAIADADMLLALARENGLRISVNFMMRFGPLWEPVRKLIAMQPLGALLHGELFDCGGDEGLPVDHWFWNECLSGGIFVEHGVHFFDLLRSWKGGGVVLGAHRTVRPETELIDQAHCAVRYGNQTTIGFYHGFHQAALFDTQEWRLIFEHGTLILQGWVAGRLELRALVDVDQFALIKELFPDANMKTNRRFKGRRRLLLARGKERTVDLDIGLSWASKDDGETLQGKAVKALITDFARSVRRPDHRCRVSGEDGRAALAIALEADRLSRRGPGA